MIGLCRRLRCDEKECFEDEERIEDEEEKRERKRKGRADVRGRKEDEVWPSNGWDNRLVGRCMIQK